MENNFAEDTLEAKWVVDSETCIEYLIDLNTGKIIQIRSREDGK